MIVRRAEHQTRAQPVLLVQTQQYLEYFDMLTGGEPFDGFSFADSGLLLAILPPGAFFSLALAVALKNHIDRKRRIARHDGMPRSLRQAHK